MCGSTCKERKKLWKEELTSLTTLVGAVATLLVVITPSEGAETERGTDWHTKWEHEPWLEGLMNLDYWMPLILMIVTGLILRTSGRNTEAGDEGPILSRVVGANLPADGGRSRGQQQSQELQWEEHRSSSAVQWGSVPQKLFFATQQRIAIT